MKVLVSAALVVGLALSGCQKAASKDLAADAEIASVNLPNKALDEYDQCDAKWDASASGVVSPQTSAMGIVYGGNNSRDGMELFRRGFVHPKTDVVNGVCGMRFVGEGIIDGNSTSVSVFCSLEGATIVEEMSNGRMRKIVKAVKGCSA